MVERIKLRFMTIFHLMFSNVSTTIPLRLSLNFVVAVQAMNFMLSKSVDASLYAFIYSFIFFFSGSKRFPRLFLYSDFSIEHFEASAMSISQLSFLRTSEESW